METRPARLRRQKAERRQLLSGAAWCCCQALQQGAGSGSAAPGSQHLLRCVCSLEVPCYVASGETSAIEKPPGTPSIRLASAYPFSC